MGRLDAVDLSPKVSRKEQDERLAAARRDAQAPPVLWHLKVSNYNEKVRWALDYKDVPHVRRAAPAGRHQGLAQKLAGRDTMPILIVDGRPIGDSTRIIDELERRWPEPPLYPADPQLRARALALEDFFDEELGPYTRLLCVSGLLGEPATLFAAFNPDLKGFRKLVARASYPVIKRSIVSTFGISDDSIGHARQRCRAAGERFRAELQPSGYLVGDSFSVADLTLAALVAPIVAPVEFPYPQPQRDHPRLANERALLDEYGIGDWARRVYARHRPSSVAVADIPAR